MAKWTPDKDGVINGTENADTINWEAAWAEAITVNANGGGDTVNFTNSTYNNKLYGYAGNDTIRGGKGNDYIDGGLDNDLLYGTAGNNTIKGQSGNDTISGGTGSDTIYGGNGNDQLLGGKGNDTIYGGSGNDLIKGHDGNDDLVGDEGNDTIDGGNGDDRLWGTSGSNVLRGQDGNDIIYGGTQKDTIWGGAGEDQLLGGSGNDIIHGEADNDIIKGNAGDDTIYGEDGNDSIRGNAGNDTLYGNDGDDNLRGEQGNNYIYGGNGNDFIAGGIGDDYIEGGDGVDKIYGEDGKDTIYGGNGGDYIYGEGGNDTIYTGAGDDQVLGGAGDDVIYATGEKGDKILKGGDGADSIAGGINNDKIYGENGNDTLLGGRGSDKIYGGEGKDYLSGGDGDDMLNGQAGNDTLKGGNGNDYLYGEAGDDKIYGEKGNDNINGGEGNNMIYFYEGDGTDTIENGSGVDTLVFEPNTKIGGVSWSAGNGIIRYGNGDDTIIVKDYNPFDPLSHSVQKVKIGNIEFSVSEILTGFTALSRGSDKSMTVAAGSPKLLMLQDSLGGSYSFYKIESDSNQTVNVKYLSNGRLRIDGDNLAVTAGTNQKDNIIIWGSNNDVYTNDLDDIVRLGGALDSGNGAYLQQSDGNYVDAGAGNDYVVYYGLNNTIEGGAGDDRALSTGSSGTSNVTNADVRADNKNLGTYSLDGEIDWFNQGGKGGDCRLLAIMRSLSDAGKKLSDYVTITKDARNYTVTFKNYHHAGKSNSTTVNNMQIAMFGNVYGDLDMVIIDCALNKLINANTDSDYYSGQDSVETADYNTLAEYIFGNEDLTCASALVPDMDDWQDKIPELWSQYKNGTIDNLTVAIIGGTDDYEMGIITGHAYSLENLTDDYISLINVWDSEDRLNLDLDTFYDLQTATLVYGKDIYDQHIHIVNGVSSSGLGYEEIDGIMQEAASWQASNVSIDLQNQYSFENIANSQTECLAVNAVIQNSVV